MKELLNKLIYPFIFAAYPIFALLGHNIEEIPVEIAIRSLVISLLVSVLFFLILKVIMKDRYKAALTTSFIMILFFSYGHVYLYLKESDWGSNLAKHIYLSEHWIILLVLFLWWILRRKNSLQQTTVYLNIIAALLLVIPIVEIVLYSFRSAIAASEAIHTESVAGELDLPESGFSSDIYYIVLDTYSRDDVLKDQFNIDNQEFINELEKMGFYVSMCSRSNYGSTYKSLSTSLNMDYLENIIQGYAEKSSRQRTREAIRLIWWSATRKALEDFGYKTIAFETGYRNTEIKDAGLYLAPNQGTLAGFQIIGPINTFENLLLRTTAAILVRGKNTLIKFTKPNLGPRLTQYNRTLFVLDQLEKLPYVRGQKFVFAHMIMPKPPYVFGPNGEFKESEDNKKKGYKNQVLYINKRLIPLLHNIIQESATPPIIILQGDHGARKVSKGDRLAILNAYYFPYGGNKELYMHISPVNTFRVLFNYYFGGSFEIVEDLHFYPVVKKPYDFTTVPETRPICQ